MAKAPRKRTRAEWTAQILSFDPMEQDPNLEESDGYDTEDELLSGLRDATGSH